MEKLIQEIKQCKICEKYLALGPNPVFTANEASRILLIGQAPGRKVHYSGIPWDDKSGDNLRNWLGVDKTEFYNPNLFALVPMGFCFPGSGKSGDLPPRKECAPFWHQKLMDKMPHIQLTLLIGQYAQEYYLKKHQKENLTETVRNFEAYLPNYFPLPHPSPRNNIWQKKNEWFIAKLLPELKRMIHKITRSYTKI